MAGRKKPRSARKGRTAPVQLLRRLEDVKQLIQRRQWAQAHDLLGQLDRAYPQQEPILHDLVTVATHLDDPLTYQYGCEGLLHLRPDDPDLLYMLATASAINHQLALALVTFRRAVERDPHHEKASLAREGIAKLEPAVAQRLTELGMDGPQGLDLLAMHEEIQALLAQGRYAKAREVAERLLERRPQFAPALNNTAEAWFRDGRLREAIAAEERVLGFEPTNVHAGQSHALGAVPK